MLKIFQPLDFKNAKPRHMQQTYVVQPGDTLAGIALRHGMKEAQIRAINNLWEGNVFAGQEIVVHRKQRSKSLPQLPSAGLTGKKAGFESVEEQRPPEEAEKEPVVEDDWVLTDSPPRSNENGKKLSVIFEHHPHKDAQQTQAGQGKSNGVGVRRIKVRSFSARFQTHQEEEDNIFGLPKLLGGTWGEVLANPRHADLVPKLEACLPMRYHGYDWRVMYSSAKHGSSLHTLLRLSQGKGASIIIVETCDGDVFGGFNTSSWTTSTSYYGTGECFVFTTAPKFEVFTWKRTNSMFMLSDSRSIAMGGGGGFAWILNADLSRGSTSPSDTFMNRRLTPDADFEISTVEVWGFETKI
ncbi:hypothetical protein Poli38472_002293 [Pythium oligandrum]|uniref:Oxidation resistance protein 1 n=1 Tax=Pythium oligandrum TaxID=41045 RepID=A0A8K1CH96_PYTOL|nr:hypothetical protein Poli38472_002293 [Pythium oligandrum]|eukprot:TMW63352.1 hypothetical protein Poli38472_002293 [Pythium oligandrum]